MKTHRRVVADGARAAPFALGPRAAGVVSMPCMDAFFDQAEDYRRSVIGDAKVKVAVEAAVRNGWDAIIGDGPFIGMSGYGASGPYKAVYMHFGITPEAVAQAAADRVGK